MLNGTQSAITLTLFADSLLASHTVIRPIDSGKMCFSSQANHAFCQRLLGTSQASDKVSIWATLFYRLNPQQMSSVTTQHKTHIEQRQVLQQTVHQHRHQHTHSLFQQHQHWHLLSIGAPMAGEPIAAPIKLSPLAAPKTEFQAGHYTHTTQNWRHTVTQNALPQLKTWISKRLFKAITPIIKQAKLLKTTFNQAQQPTRLQKQGTADPSPSSKATMISRPLILNTFNPYTRNGISYRISQAQRLSTPVDVMHQAAGQTNLLKQYNRQYLAIRQLLPYQISSFLGRDITAGVAYKAPQSTDSTQAYRTRLSLIPGYQDSSIQGLLPSLQTHPASGLSLLDRESLLHRKSLQKIASDKAPSADTSLTRLALNRLLPMLPYNTMLNNPSLINTSSAETPILKTVFSQLKQAVSTPLTMVQKAPELSREKRTTNESRPQLIYPKTEETTESSSPKEPTKTKDSSTANMAEKPMSSLYNEQGFSRQLTQKLAEDVYQLINQKIRFEKRRRGLS